MSKTKQAKLSLVLASIIFGTLGGFTRFVTMPSTVITMVRGLIGACFLLLIFRLQKKKPDFAGIRKQFGMLVLSGLLLSVAMIAIVESYKYLTVAVATMFYDLAPMIFVAVAPFFFKETLNLRKVLCILTALTGVVLVSNLIETGLPKTLEEAKGVLWGLACAFSYAAVIVINKKITAVSALDKTMVQLLTLGLAMIPLNLLTGAFPQVVFSPLSVIMALVVSVVHTGLAYLLYFSPLEHLPANTAAILVYVEPVTAVLMSTFILHEPITLLNIVGVVLVLGAAVLNEFPMRKPQRLS